MLNDLANAKDPSHAGLSEEASANDQIDKIKKLKEQLASQSLMMKSKIEQLVASKNEIEDQFEKQLKQQAQDNHQELEGCRNDYSQRMLEDAARYQTMQETQQMEARKFREAQAKVYQDHVEAVAKKQKDH